MNHSNDTGLSSDHKTGVSVLGDRPNDDVPRLVTENEGLEIRKIGKRFKKRPVLRDVSMNLNRGEVVGLLGPNGAGKTTTIRMILDIVKPSSGDITILGADSALDVRNRIGYLPEEKGLYKKMKAWAIIAYFARLKGMPSSEAKTRAFELLERYGLGDFVNAKVETLSKGMGQKVQVLASIAHRPDFVILDEPFSGLDPPNQQVMEQVISDLNKEGATIIFSTHVIFFRLFSPNALKRITLENPSL